MKLLDLRIAIDALIAANPNTQSAPATIEVSGDAGTVEITGISIVDTGTASREVTFEFTPIVTP